MNFFAYNTFSVLFNKIIFHIISCKSTRGVHGDLHTLKLKKKNLPTII